MNAYNETVKGLEGLDRRRDLCAKRVTLNGQPAVISGAKLPFATVLTLDPCGLACEFAWSTVDRIIANGGQFST